MIPNNQFTDPAAVSTYLYLQDAPYTPLSQTVMGGIAIGNGSAGRLVKPWTVFYESGLIQVKPNDGNVVLTLPATNVKSVSLAFDGNMSPVINWQISTTAGGMNLYYFDAITNNYITRFFANTNSCRVAVDDPRDFYTASSDVIVSYTINGYLYYRIQRERYDIQRLIGPAGELIRLGANIGDRLQFQYIASDNPPHPQL